MTSKVAKDSISFKDSLFSGDISYETFMSDYFNKKPCILSCEGSFFAGHSDSSTVNNILAHAGPMVLSSERFMFALPREEMSMEISELYTSEKAVEYKRIVRGELNEGQDMRYVPFMPSLKAHMVRRFFSLGGSLRMFYPDAFDKKIAKLLKNFEDVFQVKLGSRLFYHYISDPRVSTRHHHDYDAFFAVQMKGKKRWILTERIVNNAKGELIHQLETASRYEDLYNESKKRIVMDIVLKPGQVLYVPGSYGHSVFPSGNHEGEVCHLAFQILDHLTFENFRSWKKKTVYKKHDPDMSLINFQDLNASLTEINALQSKTSIGELEEFQRFIEKNTYTNVSDGFMPQESVAERVNRGTEESAFYCPIFAPRFIDNGDHISLTINTEEYQLEPDMANYFKVLLAQLFKKKECRLIELVSLPELTDKEMLVETLQALFDNGIINIS